LEIIPGNNRLRRERIAAGEFDLFLGSAQIAVPGKRDMIGYMARPDQYTSRHSLWTLQSSPLQELAIRLESTIQPDLRADLVSEIWDLWLYDLPATPLVASVSGTVARSRVRGLSSPHRTFPMTFIDELWIEEEKENPGGGK
jgi:hypothetical protein